MTAWLPGLFGGTYTGRKVLVTGHTGFKGSWLALWLQAMGAHVCGLALPAQAEANHAGLLGLKLDEALIDLRDGQAVHDTVSRFKPEVVFHLAAQALVRHSYREPCATFDTNVMGLVHLLEAVRSVGSVRAIVNATTDKCYEVRPGRHGYVETDALGGHDPYSASKACAEMVSASYRASFLRGGEAGRQPVALATARAGNVIGGGDWAVDRLVPDLVRAAMVDCATPVRSPHAIRPWQHVLEPLSGYLLLGQRLLEEPDAWAQAWNFGPDADDHLTVAQVIEGFVRCWPGARHEIDLRSQPHETTSLHLECGKARELLRWRPVWRARTSIARTVQWYRAWHETGRAASRDDLQQYVLDAGHAGLDWARR